MNFAFFTLLPLFLFFIAIAGIALNRKNILTIIMSIELILLTVNFNFLISSVYLDDRLGQLIPIFVLTVAAAESSIGLAILISYYRNRGTINLEFINQLKG
jgi:NADH-quinone oxidoreductase subunit K|mmetsp:Transcript_1119/g.2073  ORF Transcript_1119/g.2073 Transcript_1119/m.2073 type:complete len:101 (-) Transcript_1119:38-340(-)